MKIFSKEWYETMCLRMRLQPERDRGQHFLIDRSVAERIALAAEIEGKTVLEIGPGFGVLTAELVARAKTVITVETEKKFTSILGETLNNPENLQIITEDFLMFDERSIAGDYHLVTNLPYSISTPVFYKVIESDHTPQSITMLLQKEVVARVCTKAGDMNQLALLIQLYGTPKRAFTVSHEQFWPRPKVQSAVLHLVKHDESSPIAKRLQEYNLSVADVIGIARVGFLNTRKQLINSLSSTYPHAREALACAGILETARPETLSIMNWIELAHIFTA